MGIYYDIFYDRENPKKAYKIPYAGDYYQSECTIGQTKLQHVGDSDSNLYTYVTDYGEDGGPKGIESTKFFKQFGADTYNNKVIFLSGLDGGIDYGVGATPYIRINRQHYPTENWGRDFYRSEFSFVALGGKFRFNIYVINDGIEAAYVNLPNVTYGDFKQDMMTYILMPNSIRDMLSSFFRPLSMISAIISNKYPLFW